MLGRAFVEVLGGIAGVRVEARTRQELDVTDHQSVMSLADLSPDIIVHCAATVDAEGCETDPENCRNIQVDGTVNVADLAHATGAQVLYPQSFLIFDGSETPIVETTPPAPMSIYGQCKLDAELSLRDRVPDALVVCMAGFFGGDEKDKNFVGKFVPHIFKLIGEGVSSFECQRRTKSAARKAGKPRLPVHALATSYIEAKKSPTSSTMPPKPH